MSVARRGDLHDDGSMWRGCTISLVLASALAHAQDTSSQRAHELFHERHADWHEQAQSYFRALEG